uniref:ATP12 family chaperone protein n=1 Tax=Altererythrobacter segetis TaxID=1104773 RepID=UPI00140DCD58|nr:ATP12 family protein [Altererythrobacter segetis]
MKRFYKDVAVESAQGGFRLTLDGRPIRTQGGAPQVVPTRGLAGAMAEEWRAQGAEIDPRSFALRDLADFAIDHVVPDPATSAARLLPYAETDTLCYRADPDEPLYRRQQELWEPLLLAIEARHGLRLDRVSGIVHRPQPVETLGRLRAVLETLDPFTLAALETLTNLAASLTVGLLALEPDADPDALFAASNCEQDWQAELWGWEWQAEEDRARRLESFRKAYEFAQLARSA